MEKMFVNPKYGVFDLETETSNQGRQSAAEITHSERDIPIGEVVVFISQYTRPVLRGRSLLSHCELR
jgi:hypothetical protein